MSKILKIFFSSLGILILWFCKCLFLNNIIGENSVNSVSSGLLLYFYVSLFLLIVSACSLIRNKTEEIHDSLQGSHMLHKLDHMKCNNINEENLKTLFKLSSNDLLNDEFVSKQKNANKIKDPINKCAVVFGLDINFSIDKEKGFVYKSIQFEPDGDKFYYQIPYKELNRCIEMKEDLILKYNIITDSNWETVAGIK